MSIERVEIGPHVMYCGDCLEILPTLAAGSVGAVVTDPPYSSGGQFRSDRAATPSSKYVQSTSNDDCCRDEFSGDNRDQRAFLAWSALWWSFAFRAANDGAVAMCFTDWRQLPITTDAIQAGGWIWRNIVTWWKPGIRMQRGRFSSSSEYVVYASRGVPTPGELSPQNVLSVPPVAGVNKRHIAEKPRALLRALLGVTTPDAVVLDPFMGSGATAAAADAMGRRFIGIEIDRRYFDIACERLAAEHAQGKLFEAAI